MVQGFKVRLGSGVLGFREFRGFWVLGGFRVQGLGFRFLRFRV